MNNKCAFCSDQIKKRAIEKGDFAIVVLSNPRIVAGHLLIIPKRHIQKISDLSTEEIKEIFKLLAKYQEKILKKLSRGTETRQNYAPYKKNNRTHVNHFHFNLFPRNENDDLSKKVDVIRRKFYKELSENEKQKIIKLLKN